MKLNQQGRFWGGLAASCGVFFGTIAGIVIHPFVGVIIGLSTFGIIFFMGALCCASGRSDA